MKANLMQHRPEGCSEDEFRKSWENNTYAYQPLYDYLTKMINQSPYVTHEDFDCPNHYAQLIGDLSKKAAYAHIRDLLPPGCSK
jgi:hypothetical protein